MSTLGSDSYCLQKPPNSFSFRTVENQKRTMNFGAFNPTSYVCKILETAIKVTTTTAAKKGMSLEETKMHTDRREAQTKALSD